MGRGRLEEGLPIGSIVVRSQKKKGYSPTCSKDTYVYDSLLHFLVLINLFFLEFIPLGCDEGERSGGMLHQKVSIC